MSFPYSAAEYTRLLRDVTTRQCGEMGTGHTQWRKKAPLIAVGSRHQTGPCALTLQAHLGPYEKAAAIVTEGSKLSAVEWGWQD